MVALLIDGIEFAGQVMVVALGVAEDGTKHVLGLWQGATENLAVVKALLENRIERGLDLARRYLLVIDGAKALRAAVDRVFGQQAEVQRYQFHKRHNVTEHLPESCRADYDWRLRQAYALADYGQATAASERIWRQLCEINPSAARSLEEWMEETLTLHRLGVGELLRRTLSTTNTIESCLSTVRHVTRNVKHWQGGDHIARWTAAGLAEREQKFRRVKGYRSLADLVSRLNPSLNMSQEVA